MDEYGALGHMTPSDSHSAYVPHHGVWQESSKGSQLRVVFDALYPSTAYSLNDLLMAGLEMKTDICKVLIQFRMFRIALCAKIIKMYQQIFVHPEDRCF